MSVMIVLLVCIIAILSATSNAFSKFGSNTRYATRSHMTMGRKPMMAGNWKLNPKSIAESLALSAELVKITGAKSDVDIVVFPPMPFLYPVQQNIAGSVVKLGGQNCYHEDSGAYTGATSTCMLKDIGVEYVMCGHSERRSLFGDKDSIINKKVLKVLGQGLKPVLCIGETQDEYEAGLNHEVCAIQIMKDLSGVSPEQMKDVTLAYEPVWAIGTGLVCPKEVAQEVHCFIRSLIAKKYGDEIASNIIIQYGGSVNAGNVKELMAMPDIDGCLVGGASLTAEGFSKIINFQDQ